jgi:hypothetical protein
LSNIEKRSSLPRKKIGNKVSWRYIAFLAEKRFRSKSKAWDKKVARNGGAKSFCLPAFSPTDTK